MGSKVELTKIKGREIELEENEEYIISLSRVEGSAIEYVKVTLAEVGEAHLKGEEGKREGEYLKGDVNKEDIIVVMGGKVEEEKLRIELKIKEEEVTRKLVEGAILWNPTIEGVRVKIYKEGEEEVRDLKLNVGKENVVLGEAIEVLREHE